ncbi:MAG: hypothetical protein ACRELY_25330 [Polyangiaceae bacterium]
MIGRLADANLELLGIEIWLATDPGPTIPKNIYHWEASEAQPSESRNEYVKRVATDALRFVESFAFDPEDDIDGAPYFNLT